MLEFQTSSRIAIAAAGLAATGAMFGAAPAHADASSSAPLRIGAMPNLLPQQVVLARTDQFSLPLAGSPETDDRVQAGTVSLFGEGQDASVLGDLLAGPAS